MKIKVLVQPDRYFYLCLLKRPTSENLGTSQLIITRDAKGPECCVVIPYSQLPGWTQSRLLALEVYLWNRLVEVSDASRITFYFVSEIVEEQLFSTEEVVETQLDELLLFLKRCALFDSEVICEGG
ncbi:MAG: hypothetical protein DRN29_05150 [Thermoplasmata archaeon]|nr:MAG: hypothetical protein DRN29_05150 [Thermoplasmata archaeon]